jgi:hypothetical protein
VGTGGGIKVKRGLDELREALELYYGALNEIKMGHPALRVKIPEKPAALKKLETCRTLGLPLLPGGVLDQPHLWLLELQVIHEVKNQFEAISVANIQQE